MIIIRKCELTEEKKKIIIQNLSKNVLYVDRSEQPDCPASTVVYLWSYQWSRPDRMWINQMGFSLLLLFFSSLFPPLTFGSHGT